MLIKHLFPKMRRWSLEHAIPFLKTAPFLAEDARVLETQNAFETLADEGSWDPFLHSVKDLSSASKFAHSGSGRTLLHLAVLDNRLEVIEQLKHFHNLKSKKDTFGLTPIDLAQLLGRKEALDILCPKQVVHDFFPHIEPLSQPIFEKREEFEFVLETVARAKQDDEIPAEKIWMGVYYDKELCSPPKTPVSIRFINEEIGYGVFAEKKISACSMVGEYTGVIEQKKPSQIKGKVHCLRYSVWGTKKNFVINAEKKGNFTRFINHSESPNLSLHSIYWRGLPRMIFVALKEISPGMQLTFDYGTLFWKELKKTPKLLHDF
jgi:hypothetical protein